MSSNTPSAEYLSRHEVQYTLCCQFLDLLARAQTNKHTEVDERNYRTISTNNVSREIHTASHSGHYLHADDGIPSHHLCPQVAQPRNVLDPIGVSNAICADNNRGDRDDEGVNQTMFG